MVGFLYQMMSICKPSLHLRKTGVFNVFSSITQHVLNHPDISILKKFQGTLKYQTGLETIYWKEPRQIS
jgi:hypothetical protein